MPLNPGENGRLALSFLIFVWAAMPALGFLLGRLLPFPEREWRAPLASGLLSGALLVAIRGMRLGQLSLNAFEEAGALLFIFLLGTSTMRWTIRSSTERGQDASAHVASVALLAAAGAVATAGGVEAVLMVVSGLAVGLGTGLAMHRHPPPWVGFTCSAAVIVAPLMMSFADPSRLARTFFAFAGGALVATLLLSRGKIDPKHGSIAVAGLLFAALPWLFATP